QGLDTVKLKPGNTLRPQTLWETVRKNDVDPKETIVVAKGEMQSGSFKVSGTNQVFALGPDTKHASAIGKAVVVRGTLTPPKDAKAAATLVLTSIEGGG